MKVYKVKSLVERLSNEQVDRGCNSVSFISFRRVIESMLKEEARNIKELKGYRITDEGIELIWNN